jgi:hypothetical protein
MRFRKQRVQIEPIPDPWMDKTFVVNDKPTSLRMIRRFAMDMSEVDYRNDAERGLAMTIVALVDELSWLHAQLLDARKEMSDVVPDA